MPSPKNPYLNLVAATLVAVGFWVPVSLSLAGERASIQGRVVGVHDGDTVTILTPEKMQLKIRLEGIDAPELKQPFGQSSKAELSEIVFGKHVSVRSHGTDRYKRTIGRIACGEIDVNLVMVKRGMAWRYDKYSKERALIEAQIEAKSQRVGLWIDKNPVAPWEWRSKKTRGSEHSQRPLSGNSP
jgi:micrococcal nuclease